MRKGAGAQAWPRRAGDFGKGRGAAFPRAGGARDSQPLTSFGKSDIIASRFIFSRKFLYKASRQLPDSCSDKLSEAIPTAIRKAFHQ
ncbi:hypothetical protein EFP10_116 [Enterococcus phage EF-P10]|nr:hypothetical protein EFP10_116 [Enterococcus phage EF-P10]